jgi:hypothetical protein
VNAPKYSLTNDNVSIFWDGQMHTLQKGSPNYDNLRKAIINEAWEEIPRCLDIAGTVKTWAKGHVSIENDTLVSEGTPLPPALHQRVMDMVTQKKDPQPLLNFWHRVQMNPNPSSVAQLWDFLQHNGIPLTPAGTFLAYKGVRKDFYDAHSGTIKNEIGAVIREDRSLIDPDPNSACGRGLHVGSYEYARKFAPRTIICEVDPMHVVSVPRDHSHMKMRVCEYRVVSNYGTILPDLVDEPVKEKVEKKVEKKASRQMPFKECLADPEPTLETWQKFDNLNAQGLLNYSIAILRKYASSHVKVSRAYYIPGGKVALVMAIQEARHG